MKLCMKIALVAVVLGNLSGCCFACRPYHGGYGHHGHGGYHGRW